MYYFHVGLLFCTPFKDLVFPNVSQSKKSKRERNMHSEEVNGTSFTLFLLTSSLLIIFIFYRHSDSRNFIATVLGVKFRDKGGIY